MFRLDQQSRMTIIICCNDIFNLNSNSFQCFEKLFQSKLYHNNFISFLIIFVIFFFLLVLSLTTLLRLLVRKYFIHYLQLILNLAFIHINMKQIFSSQPFVLWSHFLNNRKNKYKLSCLCIR